MRRKRHVHHAAAVLPSSAPAEAERRDSEAAHLVRDLMQSLVRRRRELHLSQTVVAARMGTSQAALARMETGTVDPRVSTLERYALAIGESLDHRPVSVQQRGER